MKVVQYQINIFTANRETVRAIAEELLPYKDMAIIVGSYSEINMTKGDEPDERVVTNHMSLRDMAK